MGDPVIEYMQEYNIPMTREKYIALYYMDKMPEEWTEEHEEMLPEQFRKKKRNND